MSVKDTKVFKKLRANLIFFFSGCHLIHPLKMELRNSGQLEKGIHFLKKKYPIFKPRSILFLINLYTYLLTIKNSIRWKEENKQKLIVHFCCWGEKYAEKARDFLLPSLLAKNNLPTASQKHAINIFIHCDIKTKILFEKSKVMGELEKYAVINIKVLPDKLITQYNSIKNYPNFWFFDEVNRHNLGLRYLFLGALQANALQEGIQHQALVSFLMPDSVLSDSFYSYALNKIKGKKLILTTTFRTNFNGVRQHLAQHLDESQSVCTISGNELSKLQVEHLHETEQRRIIAEDTNHFLACARFIFKAKDGLILRALHYHPILMDCSKIADHLKIDYFPIDDSILKQILQEENLPYEEQVWLCSDTSKMNFMELSEDNPEVNEPPVYNAPSTYDSLLNSIYLLLKACPKDLDEKMNRFFIRNELKFVTETECYSTNTLIDSEKFLTDLYERIDSE